jgi:hypothetical protein
VLFRLAFNEPAVAFFEKMELVISNLQTGRWPKFRLRINEPAVV